MILTGGDALRLFGFSYLAPSLGFLPELGCCRQSSWKDLTAMAENLIGKEQSLFLFRLSRRAALKVP
jgi:hypothetical protein